MACARCYWKLRSDGQLVGYNHQEAVNAAKPKSYATAEWEARQRVRKIVRSISARQAVKQSCRERAASASEHCGGVDLIVLSRIKELTLHRLDEFRRRFSETFSSNAAAYVLKMIGAMPDDHVLKPETAWRCVRVFCLIATVDERRELTMTFCSRRRKPRCAVNLELGAGKGASVEQIANRMNASAEVESHLNDLSGGDALLKAQWTSEYASLFSEHARGLEDLMDRSVRGGKECLGQRTFELPWVFLTVTVRPRPLLERIFSWLR
jgi:hypothetical protein